MKNKQIQEYPEKELRLELERRGYFTRNLWQIEDVKTELEEFNSEYSKDYKISDEDCLNILDETLADKSGIYENIQWELRDRYKFTED